MVSSILEKNGSKLEVVMGDFFKIKKKFYSLYQWF
jgi:hypothetical protein